MSRLKPKKAPTDVERLVGKAEAYTSRLGMYRYIIVFKRGVKVHGKLVGIFYTGKTVNGRLVGALNGVNEESIRGQRISLHKLPEELIEDALRWA